MAITTKKRGIIDSDVEAASETAGSSPLTTPSMQIVSAVPGGRNGELGMEGSSESLNHDQLQLPITTGSNESSEGFSLVDDAGDSLPGSEGLSEGSQSAGSSSVVASPATSPPKETASSIFLKSTYFAVRRGRWCFWLVWVVGTISVTTSLWAMAKNEGENRYADLQNDIDSLLTENQVDLLEQIWKSRLGSKLQGMEALGTSMTSTAKFQALPWPFVSIPDFARQAAALQSFSFWMPLIRGGGEEGTLVLESWGNYSRNAIDDWIDYDQRNRQLQENSDKNSDISDTIFETGPDGSIQQADPSAPYYSPIWQHAYPIQPSLINYNLRSHPQLGASIEAVVDSRQPILSQTFLRNESSDGGVFFASILAEDRPTALLFYPIFEDFATETSELVGILSTIILWDELLTVESVASESMSRVAIPLVDCSGERDEYETVWLDLQGQPSASSTGDNWGPSETLDLTAGLKYHGIPLKVNRTGACSYSIQVTRASGNDAEADTLDQEENRIPINIVTGVLVFAFSLALAFLWFDRKVRYRDNVITKEADRTRNIVTSLFPEQVHDRLFQSAGGDIANGLPNSPDLQKMGEVVSGFFEVPLKGESEVVLEKEDHRANGGSEEAPEAAKTGELATSTHSARPRTSSNDSFSVLSTNSKQGSMRGGLLARTASMRSMRKLSGGGGAEPTLQRLRSLITSDPNTTPAQSGHVPVDDITKDEPIADLFPDATVMFADISGFTAWSSAREPAQVFKLLETIYRSFDKLARKRNVFKVETIGDCYVAVTGLPQPQPDHAIIMAKFSKECMGKMRAVTRKLEVSLGPDTGKISNKGSIALVGDERTNGMHATEGDLCMRFGMHSGPVTAGVLRGEKSRFQLFGDTVNYASRMESTGLRNRIQCSQDTADLLIASGRANWVHPREELVHAKGKGQVQTYWINPRSNSSSGGSVTSLNNSLRSLGAAPIEVERKSSLVQLKSRPKKTIVTDKKGSSSHSAPPSSIDTTLNASRRSLMSSSHHSRIWSTTGSRMEGDDDDDDGFDDDNRQERLIDWNVQILSGLLKRIVAWREATTGEVANTPRPRRGKRVVQEDLVFEKPDGQNALDEIVEIIPLASSAPSNDKLSGIDITGVELSIKVENQLREYVTMIACMYRDNFFHNFEHASHVLMSSQKLLQRVIAADKNQESELDDGYTSIIASDPLTQFAIVFAALIHDVDHTGVPNMQLVKENAHIASLYKNKSIAEQNSLDLAWDLLMSREYRDLQRAIFANQAELQRFRQLVVNVVLATDIFDPDMIKVRNSRWEKAFGETTPDSELSVEEDKSLKATIVIEYIMQASDVSHTMQHWQVYRKWNERLFEEMYSAFQVQRGDKDPSIGWYKGELWFFDNYIIPLAKKLKACRVFGAASDVCLDYAIKNRAEWEENGEEIVRELVQKHAKDL